MSDCRSPKHCHLCGRSLEGRGRVYPPDGAPGEAIVVCQQCRRDAPRCDLCGVPMGEQHVALPDGRRICPRCHRTAVYDAARAEELFEHVARILSGELGLGLNVGADLTLVDSQHLQRLAVDATPALGEDAGTTVGLFVRKGGRRTMYLLSGLPQILLIQTIAHEWAHAWQGENCPLLRHPLVREGFAEWVAYKTLQAMGAVRKTDSMERQNGRHGDMLRRMLALERKNGIEGVLSFCRRAE